MNWLLFWGVFASMVIAFSAGFALGAVWSGSGQPHDPQEDDWIIQ